MKFLAVSLLALTTIAAPTAKKEDARDALLVRAQAVEASLGHIKDLQASGCSIISILLNLTSTLSSPRRSTRRTDSFIRRMRHSPRPDLRRLRCGGRPGIRRPSLGPKLHCERGKCWGEPGKFQKAT